MSESWCKTCKGCENKKKDSYYCNNYMPLIKNTLDFIDNIIKKWQENKKT